MFNIFKKNKSKDIVNPLDNINIDDYKDLDLKEKEYVDSLIDEYKILFKEISSIIDIDKDIYNEFKMYQELIINIISKLNNNNILENIISLLKLKVYLDELNNIYDKLKYKLISLNEIKNNKEYIRKETLKYYLGKIKININNSLSNLINNVSLSLVNNYTLINIVNKEIINLSSIITSINLNDYNKEINNKLNKINKDYNLLFNNDLNMDNNLTKLILEEIELEKFTYLNKDKKQELLNRLEEIVNCEIKDKNKQNEIINNLMSIKTYFNIFNTYGRNIIKEEELNELYRIIFNAYTYFIYDCDEFIEYYRGLDGYEKDYYDKIINFKIEMIYQGKSPAFNNVNNKDRENIISLLVDYDIYVKLENIISKKAFSLLLSLDEENGFESFYKNMNVTSYELDTLDILIRSKVNIYNVIYSLDRTNNYTLYNIYKIFIGLYEGDNYSNVMNIVYNNSLYKIFKIIFKNKLDFNIMPDNFPNFDTYNFKNYLNKCDKNRPIILPDTVKYIKIYASDFVLNDYPYIKLSRNIKNLIINTDENRYYANIIMPLEVNECNITSVPFRVSNLIFRKEILDMNDEELKEYLKKIYSRIIIKIKNPNNYDRYVGFNKVNKLYIYLNKICIGKNDGTYDKLAINYDSLSKLDIDNIETSEFIDKVITCIIDCINNYKKGIYKIYSEPSEIDKILANMSMTRIK